MSFAVADLYDVLILTPIYERIWRKFTIPQRKILGFRSLFIRYYGGRLVTFEAINHTMRSHLQARRV